MLVGPFSPFFSLFSSFFFFFFSSSLLIFFFLLFSFGMQKQSSDSKIDIAFFSANAEELLKIAHELKAENEDDPRPWMPLWNAMDPTFVVRLSGANCDGRTARDVLGQLGGVHVLGDSKPERLTNLDRLRVEILQVMGTRHDMERCLVIRSSDGKSLSAIRLTLGTIAIREIVILRGSDSKKPMRQLVGWSGHKSWVLLDGATESDEVICTVREESDSFFFDCEDPFRQNGHPRYERVRMVKGDMFLVSGCELSFQSNNDFDLDKSELENAFDPLLLHQLLSIGGTEKALQKLGVGCANWAGESGDMLVELTRSCLKLNNITVTDAGGGGHNDNNSEPIAMDDPVRFLVRALKHLYDTRKPSGNTWIAALCAGLPLFVMDLFAEKQSDLSKICEEFKLANTPDFGECAVVTLSGACASLRFDGMRELELNCSKHELTREALGGLSKSVSNSNRTFVQRMPDGQWWLWAGGTEVGIIGIDRKCSEWTPLYHGCRLKIGHHVALFTDPRHAHMNVASMSMEEELRWSSVLHDALDLGSHCALTRENEEQSRMLQRKLLGSTPPENLEKACAWSLLRLLALQPTNTSIRERITVKQVVEIGGGKSGNERRRERMVFQDRAFAERVAAALECGEISEVVVIDSSSAVDLTNGCIYKFFRHMDDKKLQMVPELGRLILFEFETDLGQKQISKMLKEKLNIREGEKLDLVFLQPFVPERPEEIRLHIPALMPERQKDVKTNSKKKAADPSTPSTKAEKSAAFSNYPACWLVIVLNMFRNLCDHWSEADKRDTPSIKTQRRGIRRFFVAWLQKQPSFAKITFNQFK